MFSFLEYTLSELPSWKPAYLVFKQVHNQGEGVRSCWPIQIRLNHQSSPTSPDILVSNHSTCRKVGFTEIKCPKWKCNCTSQKILQDAKFYVHYDDVKLQLKKDHSYCYYLQIQIAMGLSNLFWFCCFHFRRHDYSQSIIR